MNMIIIVTLLLATGALIARYAFTKVIKKHPAKPPPSPIPREQVPKEASPIAPAEPQSFYTNLKGALDLGIKQLTLHLQIKESAPGTWRGTMSCEEQGSIETTLDIITIANNSLNFEIKNLRISYVGTISQATGEIVGTFTQYGQSYPLIFKKV